ncbi:hypothetical protein D9758_015554 [Tetrapyrgos nigripes]|uniref:Uncharacterized protein n=1 Tax=Tetrapyrgos nigripes TaxID=182062 RepID=A0A8H5CD34_9AGAR|nr:hypothetical protein D9758_015554 [Tetrapyrgos nigripes]
MSQDVTTTLIVDHDELDVTDGNDDYNTILRSSPSSLQRTPLLRSFLLRTDPAQQPNTQPASFEKISEGLLWVLKYPWALFPLHPVLPSFVLGPFLHSSSLPPRTLSWFFSQPPPLLVYPLSIYLSSSHLSNNLTSTHLSANASEYRVPSKPTLSLPQLHYELKFEQYFSPFLRF